MTATTRAVRLRIACVLVLLGTCSLLLNQPVQASLTAFSGSGLIMTQDNAAATKDAFGDTEIKVRGWDEAQGVYLENDLFVDAVGTGTFSKAAHLAGFEEAKISKGTVVDSHLLFFDPKSDSRVQDVSFTFSRKILGVIVSSDRFMKDYSTDYLFNSDFLRSPDTPQNKYPTKHYDGRGWEFGNPDSFSISDDGTVLTILKLRAGSPGDQIRVITVAAPEPSTFLVFGASMAGLGIAWFRRGHAGV